MFDIQVSYPFSELEATEPGGGRTAHFNPDEIIWKFQWDLIPGAKRTEWMDTKTNEAALEVRNESSVGTGSLFIMVTNPAISLA